MLSYTQYKPSSTLVNYIECYWILRVPCSTMSPLERLIPGGRTEMILNFGNPMQFLMPDHLSQGKAVIDAHVMGQRSQIYYTKQNGDTDLMGVRFKPGGLSAFTKLPASDLLNQLIPAEEVFGITINDWKDQLRRTKNDAERISLLDQLMVQSAIGTTTEWISCNKTVSIIRNSSSLVVNELCNESESYYKKMERTFLKYVGYTPKYYFRLVRFNKALRQTYESKNSLTSICYEFDYYDQSHFIKDFRQFTGTTPRHFRTENNTIAGCLLNHQSV